MTSSNSRSLTFCGDSRDSSRPGRCTMTWRSLPTSDWTLKLMTPPDSRVVIKPSFRWSAQPAQERILWLARAEPDPAGHRARPVRTGEDRVEVQLRDLGQVVGEPGNAQQQAGQRTGVRGGP